MSSSIFIEISTATRDASSDAGNVAHAIHKHLVTQNYEADIVDEQRWERAKEFKAITFKVVGISPENFHENFEKNVQLNLNTKVSLLVFMCPDNEAHYLNVEELFIEHISPEMYVDSLMASRKDSGIVVTHVPTGISARCTGHRSRIDNQRDALSLLSAKLRESTHQVQS